MAKKEYLQRYILIIELLRRRNADFVSIQNYLMDNNIEISQRTFQRDKEEIEDLWGFEIKFNKKEGFYEIDEELSDGKFDRIAESFNLVNALNQSNSISKYIFLEQRKPKGTEHFHGILHAIQNKLVIQFQLNSYWSDPTQRRCLPLAIKEAQNRWYVIGHDLDKDAIRNYGLDRISNFKVTNATKAISYVNVPTLYEHAFGIETYETPTTIILQFENSQKKYISSLPLHKSQVMFEENDTHFKLQLFIHPSHDFMMEILRFGSWCEVLEPIAFRTQIKNVVQKLSLKYKV